MTKGKTYDEIEVGQVVERKKPVTDKKIRSFAEGTDDFNPIHLDEEFAAQSFFKQRVAHGMLSAGFISSIFGTDFPGMGTIYLSQTLKFLKPVFIGDEITVRLEVLEKNSEKKRVRFLTECFNQDGDTVLTGEAWVLPPE